MKITKQTKITMATSVCRLSLQFFIQNLPGKIQSRNCYTKIFNKNKSAQTIKNTSMRSAIGEQKIVISYLHNYINTKAHCRKKATFNTKTKHL